MKNLSLIINEFLVVAVAILFYQVHSLKNGTICFNWWRNWKKTEKPVVVSNNFNTILKIAYVNTDSIKWNIINI